MTSASQAKGDRWERELAEHLRDRTGQPVHRLRPAGTLDVGDLHLATGAGYVAIEAKSAARLELAGWCDEARQEAANAGLPGWAVVIRRRGQRDPGAAYVVLSLDEWLRQTGATG